MGPGGGGMGLPDADLGGVTGPDGLAPGSAGAERPASAVRAAGASDWSDSAAAGAGAEVAGGGAGADEGGGGVGAEAAGGGAGAEVAGGGVGADDGGLGADDGAGGWGAEAAGATGAAGASSSRGRGGASEPLERTTLVGRTAGGRGMAGSPPGRVPVGPEGGGGVGADGAEGAAGAAGASAAGASGGGGLAGRGLLGGGLLRRTRLLGRGLGRLVLFLGLGLADQPFALGLTTDAVGLRLHDARGVALDADPQVVAEVDGLFVREAELACELVYPDLACQESSFRLASSCVGACLVAVLGLFVTRARVRQDPSRDLSSSRVLLVGTN